MIEQAYWFKSRDFDANGNFLKGDANIMDFFLHLTKQFHEEYAPFYANQLFVSPQTMLALERSCQIEDNYSFGMETANGISDMDFNNQMEEHMDRNLIYAISSDIDGRDDEPVWLYIDNQLDNDTMILKYSPDDDDDDEYDIPLPEDVLGGQIVADGTLRVMSDKL